MKSIIRFTSVTFICFCLTILTSCDRNSSPEGRISNKIEELQKGMIDSLQKQNKAILDSIGAIRQELIEIRQQLR